MVQANPHRDCFVHTKVVKDKFLDVVKLEGNPLVVGVLGLELDVVYADNPEKQIPYLKKIPTEFRLLIWAL